MIQTVSQDLTSDDYLVMRDMIQLNEAFMLHRMSTKGINNLTNHPGDSQLKKLTGTCGLSSRVIHVNWRDPRGVWRCRIGCVREYEYDNTMKGAIDRAYERYQEKTSGSTPEVQRSTAG